MEIIQVSKIKIAIRIAIIYLVKAEIRKRSAQSDRKQLRSKCVNDVTFFMNSITHLRSVTTPLFSQTSKYYGGT